jgi:hypothetical protein
MRGYVDKYDAAGGEVDEETLLALRDAGTESLELGAVLMSRGQDWYTGVVHAFACGLAAFSRVIKHDPTYIYVLKAHAEKYLEYAEACVAPTVPADHWNDRAPSETLTMALARVKAEAAAAEERVTQLRIGRTSYLTAYAFKPAVPPDGYHPEGLPATVVFAAGWWEMVGNGTGFNGNHIARGSEIAVPGMTQKPAPQQVVDLLNKVHYGGYGYLVPPAWQFDAYTPYGPSSNEAFVQSLWSSLAVSQRAPGQMKQLSLAIDVINRLAQSARSIAKGDVGQ